MDNPMGDRGDPCPISGEVSEHRSEGGIAVALPPGLGSRSDRLIPLDDVDLERARTGVDRQHAGLARRGRRGRRQWGQTQSRISAGSSPCSRAYARASVRRSAMSWRSSAAWEPRDGTRSITSITRWKRSRSFRITMSNGVVTVPSSLYPRTWRLAWFVRRYVSRWISQG